MNILDDASGVSIKALEFNGDATKFRIWEGKTLALAKSRGFFIALTTDIGLTITHEEYEFGAVIDSNTKSERTPTLTEIRKYTSKQNAWAYLTSSCKGVAYGLIEHCNDNPFKAWSILQEKYMASDAESNLPELDRTFNSCKLEGTQRDPELWFNELDYLNGRIQRINSAYAKQEMQMKSHIISNMTDDYEPVTIKFRGELQNIPIEKLKKEICLQYQHLLKKNGHHNELAFSASTPKGNYKNSNRTTCSYCGKLGHKSQECRSRLRDENSTSSTNSENKVFPHITCHKCNKKGHYANRCPDKNKTSSVNQDLEELGMFVGNVMNRKENSNERPFKTIFDMFLLDTTFPEELYINENEAFTQCFNVERTTDSIFKIEDVLDTPVQDDNEYTNETVQNPELNETLEDQRLDTDSTTFCIDSIENLDDSLKPAPLDNFQDLQSVKNEMKCNTIPTPSVDCTVIEPSNFDQALTSSSSSTSVVDAVTPFTSNKNISESIDNPINKRSSVFLKIKPPSFHFMPFILGQPVITLPLPYSAPASSTTFFNAFKCAISIHPDSFTVFRHFNNR